MRLRAKSLCGTAWARERLGCSVQIRAAESESARRIDPGALAVQTPNVTPVCTRPWRDCEQREPFRARTTSGCSPVRAKAGGD